MTCLISFFPKFFKLLHLNQKVGKAIMTLQLLSKYYNRLNWISTKIYLDLFILFSNPCLLQY